MRIPMPVFGRVAKGVLYSTSLSYRAKVLWAILDEQAHVRTALTRAQLVGLLGGSLSSLDRAVEELERAGWLTVDRVRSDDGMNRPNVYTLALVAREIGPALPARVTARGVGPPPPVATGATTPKRRHQSSPVTTPLVTGDHTPLVTSDDLSTSRTTTEKENYDFGRGTHVSSAADPNAPPKCAKHPNGHRHDEPCRVCGLVRKWLEDHREPDPDVLAGRRKAQAIRDCDRCDGYGWTLPEGLEWCTHEPAPAAVSDRAPANGGAGKNAALAYLRAQRAAKAATG